MVNGNHFSRMQDLQRREQSQTYNAISSLEPIYDFNFRISKLLKSCTMIFQKSTIGVPEKVSGMDLLKKQHGKNCFHKASQLHAGFH